jgi:ribosomal protein S18 acetylase RimI-like enzyme
MRETEVIALQRGFSKLHLTVHPDNHQAVRFYEGIGWQRTLKNGSWEGGMSRAIQAEPNG